MGNIKLSLDPFFRGKESAGLAGRPTFLPGNRVYHLRSELTLDKTVEVVDEMKSFIQDYQIGLDIAGERTVAVNLVIVGIGDIENEAMTDETMESIITTLTTLVEEVDVNLLFAGIAEIPTRASLRGRWLHELLEFLENKAPILEGTQITYADIWTPDMITDLSLVNLNGKMTVQETPAVSGKVKLLAHLISRFIDNEVTLNWLGRPTNLPIDETQQMDATQQEAEEEPAVEDIEAESG
jgi:hypothetical protein